MQHQSKSLALALCVATLFGCGKKNDTSPLTERFEIRLGNRVLVSGDTLHKDAVTHRKNLTKFDATESEHSDSSASAFPSTGSYGAGVGGSYSSPSFSGGNFSTPTLSLTYSSPAVGTGASTSPGYTYAALPGGYVGGSCNLSASIDAYFAAFASLGAEATAVLSAESQAWKSTIISQVGPYACYVARALDCMTPLIPQLIRAEANEGNTMAIANRMQACAYQLPGGLKTEIPSGMDSEDDDESDGGWGGGSVDSSSDTVAGSCVSGDPGEQVCVQYSGIYAEMAYDKHKESETASCTNRKSCTKTGASGKCTYGAVTARVSTFYYIQDSTVVQNLKNACTSYQSGTWADL